MQIDTDLLRVYVALICAVTLKPLLTDNYYC